MPQQDPRGDQVRWGADSDSQGWQQILYILTQPESSIEAQGAIQNGTLGLDCVGV